MRTGVKMSQVLAEPGTRPEALSDEELFLLYRDRNRPEAFEALVHRYEGELYGYLRRYLGNASMAEDIFQATFVKLHRNREEFIEGRKLRPWLYSIATHLAIDAMRKAGREHTVSLDRNSKDAEGARLAQHVPAAVRTPIAEMEDRELRAAVRRAVSQLPEHLRSVVLLVFFQGLKYHEAAEALGIPLGTVKSRLDTALARLHIHGLQDGQSRPAARPAKKARRIRASAAAPDPPPRSPRDLVRSSVPRFQSPKQFASRVCRALRKVWNEGKSPR